MTAFANHRVCLLLPYLFAKKHKCVGARLGYLSPKPTFSLSSFRMSSCFQGHFRRFLRSRDGAFSASSISLSSGELCPPLRTSPSAESCFAFAKHYSVPSRSSVNNFIFFPLFSFQGAGDAPQGRPFRLHNELLHRLAAFVSLASDLYGCSLSDLS